MSDTRDFRPFVPTPAYPRAAALQGRDARAHGDASLVNPRPRDLLFAPWDKLYHEPFVGVTTDGHPLAGLFTLAPNGAPTAAMVQAAAALADALPPAQRRALMLPIDAREWRRWNNTEMYVYRHGLRLEEVSEAVRASILAVVRASLSAPGFEKTRDVMRLNHFLGELAGNTRVLGEWSYNFTLFGLPSAGSPWGWQLMGHHLALNCLVIGGQMVLSPAFMGAEPNYADTGPWAGRRLFQDEENGGLALMRSLDATQRAQAIVYHASEGGDLPPGRRHPADQLHLGGAFQDNRVVPYEGVPVAGFDRAQRRRLLDLVDAYVAPLPDGPRKARIDEVERHLEATRFCWIGGTGEEDTFYYRIQSPVVMIEFDHHSGVFLTNAHPAKFHIHTIVRTPNGNDYGADLLRQHYRRDHHEGARPGILGEQIHHRDDRPRAHDHGPGHSHPHDHDHPHGHDHSHPHGRDHSHPHGHDHDHPHGQGHDHAHGHAHPQAAAAIKAAGTDTRKN
ncbi:MAG: DUF3500 domain-containing protein [Burkholderiales bacterium]|nr:DUF3500 domain-containing protein [Burkholderiales bacterium]